MNHRQVISLDHYLESSLLKDFYFQTCRYVDMGIGIRGWGIDFMDGPLILTLVHVYTL